MPTSLENTTTIEYLRDHAEELVNSISGDEPLFITVGDQPKAVLVDYEQFEEYEKLKRGVLLLNILNERSKQIESGETLSVDEAFDEIEREMEWK